MEKWSVWGESTSFLLSRHWTDYLVNLSLVQREPGRIVLVFPICWFDSRNILFIFNINKTKVLLPINLGIWTWWDIRTYYCLTVCTKIPWNPSRLTITQLHTKWLSSPWCHWVKNKHWWKRKQTKKPSPQHTDEKRGLREWFFSLLHIYFLEPIKLESQHMEDRTAKLPRSWQVATRLIPASPFCGEPYQTPLLIGGYGKNRYKSAEVLSANACIQLMHSAGFWNLQPSRNTTKGFLSYENALSSSLRCLVSSTSYFIGSCQWSLLRRLHQATQCNSQEAEMSAVLVIYTGILKTQGKENGTRTLFATNCTATKRALTAPRDSD